MQQNRFRKISIVVFCFGIIFLLSCSDDARDTDENPYEKLIAVGKLRLTEGDGEAAAAAFEQALTFVPDSTDGKFGLVLAGHLDFTGFIDRIIGSVGGLSFRSVGVPEKSLDQGGDNDPIHDYLNEKVLPALERAEVVYTELAQGPSFDFTLSRFDLAFAGMTFGTLSGEFDKTDLHFFGSLNAAADGAVKLLLAHNLRFDPTELALPKSDPNADTFDKIGVYIRLLGDLLSSETYPDFLFLEEQTGGPLMKEAGIGFGNAFKRGRLVFTELAGESGSPQIGQIRFFDAGHDGRYDPLTDPITLGSFASLDTTQAAAVRGLCGTFARVFYDGSILDENPARPDELVLSDLNDFLRAFGVFPLSLGDEDHPLIIPGFPGLIRFPVGPFFSDPAPDGLRRIFETVIDLWSVLDGFL